jgi:hypothetical protein
MKNLITVLLILVMVGVLECSDKIEQSDITFTISYENPLLSPEFEDIDNELPLKEQMSTPDPKPYKTNYYYGKCCECEKSTEHECHSPITIGIETNEKSRCYIEMETVNGLNHSFPLSLMKGEKRTFKIRCVGESPE